jgi:hypothetical protein
MAIAISLWRSLSHYGDRYLIVAIAISLWRSLSHCGDRYLIVVVAISLQLIEWGATQKINNLSSYHKRLLQEVYLRR